MCGFTVLLPTMEISPKFMVGSLLCRCIFAACPLPLASASATAAAAAAASNAFWWRQYEAVQQVHAAGTNLTPQLESWRKWQVSLSVAGRAGRTSDTIHDVVGNVALVAQGLQLQLGLGSSVVQVAVRLLVQNLARLLAELRPPAT